ncbi:MAG: hypothetical protein EXR44_02235 [Dehalococcoidia bacterium]|nr:hypothetical protein [Dehalococcoidia bacterium]
MSKRLGAVLVALLAANLLALGVLYYITLRHMGSLSGCTSDVWNSFGNRETATIVCKKKDAAPFRFGEGGSNR